MLVVIIMVFITIMEGTLEVVILKCEKVLVWQSKNWHKRALGSPPVPLY